MDILVKDVPPGCSFSIVASVQCSKDGVTECMGISPMQKFQVKGADLAEGLYTLYDLQRADEEMPVCLFDVSTVALIHPRKEPFPKLPSLMYAAAWVVSQWVLQSWVCLLWHLWKSMGWHVTL